MSNTVQFREWTGRFGDAYTERNVVDWPTRLHAFEVMLEGIEVESILEVGSNRGHNLTLLSELYKKARVVGLEPNLKALEIAQRGSPNSLILRGDALQVPFRDCQFDLVFTANVLIHVALANLPTVLSEIHRVSRRYILSIEYFAEQETVIHYRGHDDLLWKRNFPEHYRQQFPELRLRGIGYWDREDGFDRSHWWLFEKSPSDQ